MFLKANLKLKVKKTLLQSAVSHVNDARLQLSMWTAESFLVRNKKQEKQSHCSLHWLLAILH